MHSLPTNNHLKSDSQHSLCNRESNNCFFTLVYIVLSYAKNYGKNIRLILLVSVLISFTNFSIAQSAMLCTWEQVQRMPRTAFGWMPEFSGCISYKEAGRFIVCSDERTIDKAKDPRGPANSSREEVWLIDAPSASLAQTISLNGKQLTDMEAMADDGAGGFFIITSQSLRQDGTRNENREKLFRYNGPGETDTRKGFRDVLIQDFSFLKDFEDKPGLQNGLNVEGIAVDPVDDKMWFGLRGPLVDSINPTQAGDYAVLLELDHPLRDWNLPGNQGIKEEGWSQFQWQPPRFLNLCGLGIRDLYFDIPTRRLFILAGKMEANDVEYTPSSFLLEYSLITDEIFWLRELPQIDDGVPEQYRADLNPSGLCEAEGITAIDCFGQRGLVIVYDSKEQGIFQTIPFPGPPDLTSMCSVPTSINEINNVPQSFALAQNYPNPFNLKTIIKYNILYPVNVNIKLYNISGKEIGVLLNGFQEKGEHEIVWHPKQLPSGIYFYRLQAGNFSEIKKLIYQK